MSDIIFKVSNFTFNYPFSNKKINIVGDFCIYKNDVVLISGASGVGKSTLLYALKGLIPNTINGSLGGLITYFNKNIANLSHHELMDIGLVMQNPDAQILRNTVMDELAFGLENLKYSRSDIVSIISRFADRFGINHLLQSDTSKLSIGEKQLINLLSILITNPKVLLLDEPTAFLDPNSARMFIDALNLMDDITIIIIEHNLNYLYNKVNRYVYIDDNGSVFELDIKDIPWKISYPRRIFMQNFNDADKLLEVRNYTLKNGFTKFNLMIKRREIVGIIGQNGVGKTRLLKSLAGIDYNPNTIYWQDQDIRYVKQYYQYIGLLWQNPENHFLYNTVSQELGLHNANFDFEFNDQSILNQNPFTLSEGQKRRLSLAILWQLNRQVYLLDEPSFGQDYKNKLLLIDMIIEMQQSGKAFVIVSHDPELLDILCTKIIRLDVDGATLIVDKNEDN